MEMVKNVVEKVAEKFSMPALGAEEDVKKAKEIVGDDITVYAALRAPPEFYEMQCADYCKLALTPCWCYPVVTANRVMKNTLYIVSDKAVKVHVDPFEPPLGIGSPTREIPELTIESIKEVKVIRKGGNCLDPREKTGLVFQDSGLEIFISDPQKLEEILVKVRELKGGAESAAAKVDAAKEIVKAPDEGQSRQ